MSLLLYNIFIWIYYGLIKVAALFHPKAQKFINGRKDIFLHLKEQIKGKEQSIIWMHCASLGEFEQGRPVLEAIKNQYPEKSFLVTFFSPSGYEIRKDYAHADYVFYLPIDTASNARKFIEIVQPKIALFVKYEFWYHFLKTLNNKTIPTILFSAVFRENQIFFKSYGKMFLKLLSYYDQIFVQNKNSKNILNKYGVTQVEIAGDTRFDRINETVKEKKEFENILTFKQDKKIIVAGSTWEADELFLKKAIEELPQNEFKLLIVPHEVHPSNINRILNLFGQDACLWQDENALLETKKVAVVDTIGQLAYLYRHADVSWVGGAFSKGLHNILEPAVYGLPVFFGSKIEKFPEAKEMILKGAGKSFAENETDDFTSVLNKKDELNKMGKAALQYATENQGACAMITDYLSRKYFETKS